MSLTTGAAALAGVGVGLFLLVFPGPVVRAQLAGTGMGRPQGEYGEDGDVPAGYRYVVQALGLAFLAGGLVFGARTVGLV